MCTRLFVYGSLRRGQRSNYLLERIGAKLVEETRLPGYDLHAVTWYPGVKRNASNKTGVVGEVYELPDTKHLAGLDLYEGYNGRTEGSLFVRRKINVGGEDTFIYEYNGKLNKGTAAKLEHGDWSKR